MNKKHIEKQIPIAIDVINELIQKEKFFEKKDKKFGQIPNEYKGYISNFGASIIQSGLVATVAFFEENDSNSKADRKLLLRLLLEVIYKHKELELKEKETLLSYVLKNKDVKEEVINVVIAVKLAMRVFEFTENSES